MTSTLCRFKRKKNIFKAVYYLTERIVDIAAVHNVSLATVIDLMELVSMAVKLVFMENTVIRVSIKWINLTHIVVAFNRCIVFYLFFFSYAIIMQCTQKAIITKGRCTKTFIFYPINTDNANTSYQCRIMG